MPAPQTQTAIAVTRGVSRLHPARACRKSNNERLPAAGEHAMTEQKLPKLPPRHPNTGPIQTDTMPDQPRPPIKPGQKQEEAIKEKEKETGAGNR
jgi:hypothetical protein